VQGFELELASDQGFDPDHQPCCQDTDPEQNYRQKHRHSCELPGSERPRQQQACPPFLGAVGLDDKADDHGGHDQKHAAYTGRCVARWAFVADSEKHHGHNDHDPSAEAQAAEQIRPRVGELSSQRVPHGATP